MSPNTRGKCRRLSHLAIAILTALSAPILSGLPAAPQSTAAAPAASALPEFEVASIRPSNSRTVGLSVYPGGRIAARNLTVQQLIQEAFHLQSYEVKGAPPWANGDRFDIDAKPPASPDASTQQAPPKVTVDSLKSPPNEEQRKMLQSLLIKRFRLQFHWEAITRKGYALTLSGKKLKLETTKHPDEYAWAGGIGGGYPDASGLRGTNISMPLFAERLSNWLKTPVLDQTGLHGAFDFTAETGEGDFRSESEIVSSILPHLNPSASPSRESTSPRKRW